MKRKIVKKRLTPSRAGDRAVVIEIWGGRAGQFEWFGNFRSWAEVLGNCYLETPLVATRRRVRIRHFYDRHQRRRVVQVLIGMGWAVR